MKFSETGELALLEILRKRFKDRPSRLVLGIGDDAAVIRTGAANMLLTTDMMAEGVHFDLAWMTPFQLGFKLVSVNVSDIYAMGGRPEFLLLDFGVPGDTDTIFFSRFFDGVEKAAKTYGVSLAGGDISSSSRVVVAATVTGYARKILRRDGARVGDRIYVTGNLGDSACGLQLMKKRNSPIEIERKQKGGFKLKWNTVRPLIQRHLMPHAVSPEKFIGSATSMMDISDGLLIDISRLCRESGVGAIFYKESIPVSDELREAAAWLKIDPYDFAFGGGEDYELIFTAPKHKKVPAFCVGEIVQSGIEVLDGRGKKCKVPVMGFQHFAG